MLRFGTVGSSWITDEYIRGAKASGLWELPAVYSRTREKGDAFAAKHKAAQTFTNLEEMASSKMIDAVYIASPNALHYQHCKLFLEHGKHVICEKPLCAQADKVKELQSIAAKHGVIYLEAIMFMHLPQRKLLEEALAEIGQISMAKIDFCQRSSKLDSYLQGDLPNIFNPRLETGSLMDLGVYCVYPALHLFGKPESFHVDHLPMKSGADGGGIVTLKYSDKLVTLTYSKLGQSCANTDFQGMDGTVSVESISKLSGISMWKKDGSTQQLYNGDEKYELMGWEAKDFYRYITEPQTSKAEYDYCQKMSVNVSEFMEEIRKQAGLRFASDV